MTGTSDQACWLAEACKILLLLSCEIILILLSSCKIFLLNDLDGGS